MPRKRKQPQQFQDYQLVVLKWHIGYFLCRAEEYQNEGSLDLALDVEFPSPIKGVKGGQISLFGLSDHTGGYLKYNNGKILQGALWISEAGAAALVTVLTAGQQIIIDLYGKPFRYRSAAIRDICWHMEGHPSVEENKK